ncbi:MAG: glycosyltransferase, partial [Acidimicrobiales bacterium]
GTAELMQQFPMCVVPYLDIDGFASAVGRLLCDPELRRAASEELGSHARSCSIGALGPVYLDAVHQALRHRKSPPLTSEGS